MQKRLRKPTPSQRRKAQFREEARSIVRDDRDRRKWGISVDTGGAIARALERAYAMGFKAAQMEEEPEEICEDPNAGMEWDLIPPRPRNLFRQLCTLGFSRRNGEWQMGCFLREVMTPRLTPGWQIVLRDGTPLDMVGARTVAPLVKLGLLADRPEDPRFLFLTRKALETWIDSDERRIEEEINANFERRRAELRSTT